MRATAGPAVNGIFAGLTISPTDGTLYAHATTTCLVFEQRPA